MSKSTRMIFIAFAIVIAVHIGLSIAFVCYVYDTTDDLRDRDTQNMLFLQAQLDQNGQRIDALQQDVEASSTPAVSDQPCVHEPSVKDEVEVQTEQIPLFTVRVYKDVIGVFDENEQLLKVVNVHYASLPEADRLALLRGIHAFSMDELLQLLAAYS